jgi:hypothetical protein
VLNYLGLDGLSSDDKSMRSPLANCTVHGPFIMGFSADATRNVFKIKRAARAIVRDFLVINLFFMKKANLKVYYNDYWYFIYFYEIHQASN